MNNHDRMVRYVMASHRLDKDDAEALVTASYPVVGGTRALLTPAQRRRVKHSRGGFRFAVAGANPQVVIMDELPQVTEIAARDLHFPFRMATRPRMTGKVREYIDARLAQNVRRAVARGR